MNKTPSLLLVRQLFPQISQLELLIRWRLLGGLVILGFALGLSGCVQADLAIQIKGQAGGEIQQHLQVSRSARPFLEQLQQQARKLGGTSKHQNGQTLDLRIPFDRPEDLSRKLNALLAPLHQTQAPTLPIIPAQAEVTDQNLLLFIRGQFDYTIDLRAFGIASGSSSDPIVLSPQELVALTISLETPWGARPGQASVKDNSVTLINPHLEKHGHTLTWALEPGYINHLQAVFIYPSLLGWGALGIVGLLSLAWYWRYRPLALAAQKVINSNPAAS
ncbi:DUF3153 domain-containing protein [Thermosynechococcaceae cyanobacterium BACA0444]|uniref:DUF3153 domain-containing protein n=1 Tax=Pseudocalidococcus azoricus BACA0444 TaxID=2918990 RepID=A0AAE4JYD0_9CYAN|nr:DUF3153 domain-containing protein [Pseudocalidococcus azoricus]MDS3860864.1 DUF3153 domain-containing protein [Pseudocalidococcus azoricus BACA0444]